MFTTCATAQPSLSLYEVYKSLAIADLMVVYKVDEYITKPGTLIGIPTGHSTPYKTLWLVHPQDEPAFVSACQKEKIALMTFQRMEDLERDAWLKGHQTIESENT